MSTPETLIKNGILEYLSYQPNSFTWPNDSVGIFDPIKKVYRKNHSRYHINGVADILGIWQAKPVAIEVKTEKGVLSPNQKLFLQRFENAGGIAIVARNVEDVVDGIRRAQR